MIKEELYTKWVEQEYEGTCDREPFFEDLETWYESRRIRELNQIKTEVLKSLRELEDVFSDAAGNEVEMRGGCTAIGPGQDCLSSELCEYCSYPPERFQMGDIYCMNCDTEYNMDEPECPYCKEDKND